MHNNDDDSVTFNFVKHYNVWFEQTFAISNIFITFIFDKFSRRKNCVIIGSAGFKGAEALGKQGSGGP